MRDPIYKSSILDSFENPNDNYYILRIIPTNYDEDYYYEICMNTKYSCTAILNDSLRDFFFIDVMPNNTLEVYNGQFYEECGSNGDTPYTYYEYKKTKKDNQTIWKPKVENLRLEFGQLFGSKLVAYEANRKKAVDSFKTSYTQQLNKCSASDLKMIEKSSYLRSVSRSNDTNPAWDSFQRLFNPKYDFYPVTQKDWKEDYSELEKAFNLLKATDEHDYNAIREHTINDFKRSFDWQLSNMKHDYVYLEEYKFINESFYKNFLNVVIEQVRQTEW